MNLKHIHIVAFDVPFPPDYGGVIDVYYKLKSLHEEGIKITLHCFEYGRGQKTELKKYCEEVFYYQRKASKHLLFNSLPYIVASRSSEELVKNLLKKDSPILFEGLHCCFHLSDVRLKDRKKIVRMHNIEHNYYANLALVEKKFFRRKYFESEAKKLEKFESILHKANVIAAISPADTQYLSGNYKNVSNIMAFHPHDKIEIKEGKGDFALYHGSLAVGENNKAALYLVNEIFNDIDTTLIIAGNGASAELKNALKSKKNIQLQENISTQEIYSLIQNAQINILPTFQATGIKLKLLSALYTGRHCMVNSPMVSNTGLEVLCHTADSISEMKKEILRLMTISFSEDEKKKREKVLEEKFSNRQNIKQLLFLLF
ncbi:MAG: glycosyltransferase [Bacteroidetes bacterium]|nr:glycosyltransferase [Bacteroidota bacterium]